MRLSLGIIFIFLTETSCLDLKGATKIFFEFIPDRFEILHETPSIAKWSLKVRKINGNRVFTGKIELFVAFTNNDMVEVKALKKQGGEFRYMPYRIKPTPLCEGGMADQFIYPDIVRGSDFPIINSSNCSFPIGTYKVTNVTTDLSNVPAIKQIAPSGEYCGEVKFHVNNTHASTYRFCGFINNI